jgi:hypothetical protein
MPHLEPQQPPQQRPGPIGSLDGQGAGDHDQPYRFGCRPHANVPYRPAPRSPFAWPPESRPDEYRGPVQPVQAQMDDVERLIVAFKARSARSVASKLDALLDLEQLDDQRIVPFLVHVLVDRCEPTNVRIHVLKRLRNGRLQPADRRSVAKAILQVVSDHSSPELQAHAVLALAQFTNIEGVQATLGGLALNSA